MPPIAETQAITAVLTAAPPSEVLTAVAAFVLGLIEEAKLVGVAELIALEGGIEEDDIREISGVGKHTKGAAYFLN